MTKELLNQALEYLEDNQHWVADGERHAYVMEYNAFIDKLKQALAQQEPVALVQIEHWRQDTIEFGHWVKTREMPKQIAERLLHYFDQASIINVTPKAPSPPQRKEDK